MQRINSVDLKTLLCAALVLCAAVLAPSFTAQAANSGYGCTFVAAGGMNTTLCSTNTSCSDLKNAEGQPACGSAPCTNIPTQCPVGGNGTSNPPSYFNPSAPTTPPAGTTPQAPTLPSAGGTGSGASSPALPINTSLPVPNGAAGGTTGTSPALVVSNFYIFAFLLAGFLAFVMIIYAGVRYTFSAGNASTQSDAKDAIQQALLGLALLLLAFLILRTINPDITNLQIPSLQSYIVPAVSAPTTPSTQPVYGCAVSAGGLSGTKCSYQSNCSDIAGSCGSTACAPVSNTQNCLAPWPPTTPVQNTQVYSCVQTFSDETGGTKYNECSYQSNCSDVTNSCDKGAACTPLAAGTDASSFCSSGTPSGTPPPPPAGTTMCGSVACTQIPSNIAVKNGDYAAQAMVTVLSCMASSLSGTGWRVTEAMPASQGHASGCHTDGCCVDTALNPPDQGNCAAVNQIITAAKSCGATNVLNEYTGCSGTSYTYTSGGNVHVQACT